MSALSSGGRLMAKTSADHPKKIKKIASAPPPLPHPPAHLATPPPSRSSPTRAPTQHDVRRLVDEQFPHWRISLAPAWRRFLECRRGPRRFARPAIQRGIGRRLERAVSSPEPDEGALPHWQSPHAAHASSRGTNGRRKNARIQSCRCRREGVGVHHAKPSLPFRRPALEIPGR